MYSPGLAPNDSYLRFYHYDSITANGFDTETMKKMIEAFFKKNLHENLRNFTQNLLKSCLIIDNKTLSVKVNILLKKNAIIHVLIQLINNRNYLRLIIILILTDNPSPDSNHRNVVSVDRKVKY